MTKKLLAVAVLLASTAIANADTTFTGVACAMESDANIIVSGLANMPALTIDADISKGPSLVSDSDACVSLEVSADQVANATFVTAKGGEQIGLAKIGEQYFAFVDGIPPNSNL